MPWPARLLTPQDGEVTPKGAAKLTGYSIATIYREIAAGLPVRRYERGKSGPVFIKLDDLQAAGLLVVEAKPKRRRKAKAEVA